METKKTTKTTTTKAKATENGVVKKRISKIMKAAEKYKGSVEILDMEALFNPVYWYEIFNWHKYIGISYTWQGNDT